MVDLVSYDNVLVICSVLMVVGVIVGTKALLVSVKEVELLRKMGRSEIEEPVIGSVGSSMLGAILAGVGSATIVALYGIGPAFLYLGPVASIVAAIGVIACFLQDLRDEKKVEEVFDREQKRP